MGWEPAAAPTLTQSPDTDLGHPSPARAQKYTRAKTRACAGKRAPERKKRARACTQTQTHAPRVGLPAPSSELSDVHSRWGKWAWPEAPQVAAAAQQVALQGVAAASILPAQLQPAVLGKNTAPAPE